MKRESIVRILRETGDLLELGGENPFRVRAYQTAARALEGLTEEPEDLLESGRLAEVPGIGPGLVASIGEIVHTGRMSLHDELRSAYPPGLLDVFGVPGLGPKKIRALHEKLRIGSIADLERAAREGRIAGLPGFGAKSQEKILAGVVALGHHRERHLLSEARPVAAALLAHLRGHPAVERAEIAGSLRRWRETIGDLDLVAAVAGRDREAVADHFVAAGGVREVVNRGDTKVTLALGGGFQADLRMVEPDQFASALLHFTGSKEHNVALRSRAKREGLTLNEYGLFRGDRRLAADDEVALYGRLGLAWIPPELREGLDEVERAEAGPIPELIEAHDVRGTFHVHTTWSDGTASLEQMARAAAALGWEFLGIADHSRTAAYAGGLQPDQVREQWREIDAWNERGERPWLFKGIESDILADGSLDYPDDLLLGFDYVVVSVHSRFRMTRDEMTARIVRAVSHPCATFLGHPTGRLLLARDGYEIDYEAVFDAALAHGTLIEVNSNPHRLDLDWRLLRGWLARGGGTSLNPDAHSPQGLRDVEFGVGVARKAGAHPHDVLNTRSAGALREFLERRRERARDQLRTPRNR
jgi:DNA polymerase (family 10)